MPKVELTKELVRAAIRDVFEVIPSDPIPNELIPRLDSVAVEEE